MASNTGFTSLGELAMTFNISAVAACFSRASFNSLPRPETDERFDRMVVGATRRLVLAGLRPFTELTLRVFAAVLPPVLDGRAISAPKGQQGPSYRAKPPFWKGRNEAESCLPTALVN